MVSSKLQTLHTWEKSPTDHQLGGWVDLNASLNAVEKKNFSTPARNQSPVPHYFNL
jgi:hypothetical protein